MTTMRRAVRVLAAVGLATTALTMSMASPASAGGGGCHLVLGGEGPTQAAGTTVELKAACMSPTVLRTEPGTEVTFVNRDAMTHNLYGAGLAVSELQLGQSATVRYDGPGTYPFACLLHPGMVGAVVVGDGRFPSEVVAPERVEPSTTTTAAPVPLAATRPLDDDVADSDSTSLVMLVSVALTIAVGAAGYTFGRRSAIRAR
jgi:plastocyanin